MGEAFRAAGTDLEGISGEDSSTSSSAGARRSVGTWRVWLLLMPDGLPALRLLSDL